MDFNQNGSKSTWNNFFKGLMGDKTSNSKMRMSKIITGNQKEKLMLKEEENKQKIRGALKKSQPESSETPGETPSSSSSSS